MLQARGQSQTAPAEQPKAEEPAPAPAPTDRTVDYRKAAEEDVPRIASLRHRMEISARKANVPVEYLEGIASRESRGGKALGADGFDPDKKDAYGVMQVDHRYHTLEGTDSPDSQEHIDQAAGILHENKRQIDKKFPRWKEEDRWRAAIAAYNYGTGNVKTKGDVDRGTTGNDYSQDVLIRAKTFRERFHTNKKKH